MRLDFFNRPADLSVLVLDGAVRQRLAQIGDTLLGDKADREIELLEIRERLQRDQARVAHFGLTKVEISELLHLRKVLETLIGDPRVVEIEPDDLR